MRHRMPGAIRQYTHNTCQYGIIYMRVFEYCHEEVRDTRAPGASKWCALTARAGAPCSEHKVREDLWTYTWTIYTWT
jgi:hypothetical protein